MIRRLDTPPRQIMVETTIAEVLLTDEFAMGVEFARLPSTVASRFAAKSKNCGVVWKLSWARQAGCWII